MKPKSNKLMLLGLAIFLLAAMGIAASAGAQGPEPLALFAHDNFHHTLLQLDTSTGAATEVGFTGFESGISSMATARGTVPGPGGAPITFRLRDASAIQVSPPHRLNGILIPALSTLSHRTTH